MIETHQFIQELYKLHEDCRNVTTGKLTLQDQNGTRYQRLRQYTQMKEELPTGRFETLAEMVAEYHATQRQTQIGKAVSDEFGEWARMAFPKRNDKFYASLGLAFVREVVKNGGKIVE